MTSEAGQYNEALEAALKELRNQKGAKSSEFRELPKILQFGELPGKLTTVIYDLADGGGFVGALLVGTNQRIILIGKRSGRKGPGDPMEMIAFPYNQISSLESKTGRVMGEITLELSGTNHRFYNIPNREASAFAEFAQDKMQETRHGIGGPGDPRDGALGSEWKQYGYALGYIVTSLALDEGLSAWMEEIRSHLGLFDQQQWELPDEMTEAKFEPSDDSDVLLLIRTNLRFLCMFRGEDGSSQAVEFPYDKISSIESGTVSTFGELTLAVDEDTFVLYMGKEKASAFAESARGKMQEARGRIAEPGEPASSELTGKSEQYEYALECMLEGMLAQLIPDEELSAWTEEIRSRSGLFDPQRWELPYTMTGAKFEPSDDSAVLLLIQTNLRFICIFKGEDGSLQVVEFPYDELSSIESGTFSTFGELTLVENEDTFVFYMDTEEASELADYARDKMQEARGNIAGPALEIPEQPKPQAIVQEDSKVEMTAEEAAFETISWAANKREFKELPKILQVGEIPGMAAELEFSGMLFATNWRVIFVDKTRFGPLKTMDFPYREISGVWYDDRGFLRAPEMRLNVSGNEHMYRFRDGGEQFTNFVRSEMLRERAEADKPAPQVVMQSASVGEELERLANLRDRGVLTDDEFNAAKARLLQ